MQNLGESDVGPGSTSQDASGKRSGLLLPGCGRNASKPDQTGRLSGADFLFKSTAFMIHRIVRKEDCVDKHRPGKVMKV
ncbi:MAG TPA: hypothetical protein DCR43_08760 [Bacteroidales bacterium]|nr:MAG: hypothetical protein A2X11_04365 [Bacteroidetes bacterium GWE2_42_24]OFY25238.1 MAG: hypothetical protein A2X09_10930 [Bacteroidetes bacterium GWF2_43_11]HAQ65924.1 hypothetical protein [Bacteroidales bacterium]HBZ66939.1 hypothetical protein [Bacteroidales bacterium]